MTPADEPNREPSNETDDVSRRAPATGADVAPPTQARLGGDASAEAHLGAGPAVDISATTPRGPDDIPLPDGLDVGPERAPSPKLIDMPSAPVNVIAGVPESQVTDHQTAKPARDDTTGHSEHPPASKAP